MLKLIFTIISSHQNVLGVVLVYDWFVGHLAMQGLVLLFNFHWIVISCAMSNFAINYC